jgi:hypothetical protein
MNDSMIGPFYPMGGVLRWIESQNEVADYVGITDNTEHEWHLSAMFVAYLGGAIRHPAYQAFWDNVRVVRDKGDHIFQHEFELSRIAIRERLRIKAMYTCAEVGVTWAPLTFGWERLIEQGLPLVKRRSVHLYPDEVRRVAGEYGEHATHMVEHALLERVVM